MEARKLSSERPGDAVSAKEKLIIGETEYTTRLTEKFRNRTRWIRRDERKVEAVIPGTIWKILVSEGDAVSRGTPLLILEAMKMRNEVCAPAKGIIKKIHVREGDQVPKSHLLVEFK